MRPSITLADSFLENRRSKLVDHIVPRTENPRFKVHECRLDNIRTKSQTLFAFVRINCSLGLSLRFLCSVASIGWRITFGVHGRWSLAHARMIMLGAYTTYVCGSWNHAELHRLFDFWVAISSGVFGVGFDGRFDQTFGHSSFARSSVGKTYGDVR